MTLNDFVAKDWRAPIKRSVSGLVSAEQAAEPTRRPLTGRRSAPKTLRLPPNTQRHDVASSQHAGYE